MDILNRSGRIPNVDDELNMLQQQKKQYISIIDLSKDEVETVIRTCATNEHQCSVTADSISSCHASDACGRTRFP